MSVANQTRKEAGMSKRANGEGNVYQRANGTWEARLTYIRYELPYTSAVSRRRAMR